MLGSMVTFDKKRIRRRRFVLLTLLFTAVFCGTMNYFSYDVNTKFINDAYKKMSIKEVPLAREVKHFSNWYLRRVSLAGTYDYSHELLIERKDGFDVFAPFTRVSGEKILVNRGFVSKENKQYITHNADLMQIKGIISYVADYPAADKLLLRDAIEKSGVKDYAPVVLNLIDAKDDNYPSGAKVKVFVNQDNLKLMRLWYGFAAFAMFLLVLRQNRIIRIEY